MRAARPACRYLFGGSSVPFNISYGQTYNDLWGLDLNDVFNSVFGA